MRRVMVAVALGLIPACWAAGQGRDSVLEMLRIQGDIERRLLVSDFATLEKITEQISSATDRLSRLSEDLIRAYRDGEDTGAFNARCADLTRSETAVTELMTSAQQLRATIAARRGYLDQVEAEVRLREEGQGGQRDVLTGRWLVAVEPGAMRGAFDLRLDGTLVTGVYQLAGGWKGSLRGTFIGGNVRLERIDSQLGFVAVYIGRLAVRGDQARLEGTWEATNLAAGLPASGTWVGQKDTRSP